MSKTIKAVVDFENKRDICLEVLRDIPQWFGIPEAVADYASASGNMQMFASFECGCVGFILLRIHDAFTIEIHVMGVKREFHRRGIGRALVDKSVEFACEKCMRVMMVKTLAESDPDPHYSATREFYKAMGFFSLGVLPTLWGPENPCLIMAKTLHGEA